MAWLCAATRTSFDAASHARSCALHAKDEVRKEGAKQRDKREVVLDISDQG